MTPMPPYDPQTGMPVMVLPWGWPAPWHGLPPPVTAYAPPGYPAPPMPAAPSPYSYAQPPAPAPYGYAQPAAPSPYSYAQPPAPYAAPIAAYPPQGHPPQAQQPAPSPYGYAAPPAPYPQEMDAAPRILRAATARPEPHDVLALIDLLASAHESLAAISDQAIGEADLNADQHAVLVAVDLAALTRAQLAREVGLTRPATGLVVEQLVQRGLVVDTDGVLVSSVAGRNLLGRAEDLVRRALTRQLAEQVPAVLQGEVVDAVWRIANLPAGEA